jgi:hypothetical protein
MKRLIVCAALLLTLSVLHLDRTRAEDQGSDSPLQAETKTSSRQEFEDQSRSRFGHLNLGVSIEYPSHEFLLAIGEGRANLAARDQRLQFSSSNSPEGIVKVSWDALTVAYRGKIDGLNSFTAQGRQPGHLHGYQAALDFKFYGIEVFYQEAKGFYVDLNSSSGFTVKEGHSLHAARPIAHETASALSTDTGVRTPEIWARPDVGSVNYGARAWMAAPLFGGESSEAIFRSADFYWLTFSGILSLGYQRLTIEGSDPLIPQSRQSTFGLEQDLLGIYQHALSALAGFRMDFTSSERWQPYFEGSVGGEALVQSVQFRDDLKRELATGRNAQFDFGLRYQAGGWLTRAFWKIQIRSSAVESTTLDSKLATLGLETTYQF